MTTESLCESPAFERNKEPILEVLKQVIKPQHKRLLEIGAGTGQHAVYLAPFFSHLQWTPTEQSANLPGLAQRLKQAKIPNLRAAGEFQVGLDDFSKYTYQVILTINTFHIMSWKECKTLMKLAGLRLQEGGKFIVYGAFKYDGQFTSASNEEFDKTLRARDPSSGVRSFEDVRNVMTKNGFALEADHEMPAFNRMLVFSLQKFTKPTKDPAEKS